MLCAQRGTDGAIVVNSEKFVCDVALGKGEVKTLKREKGLVSLCLNLATNTSTHTHWTHKHTLIPAPYARTHTRVNCAAGTTIPVQVRGVRRVSGLLVDAV